MGCLVDEGSKLGINKEARNFTMKSVWVPGG
jgi:hypothetical protein